MAVDWKPKRTTDLVSHLHDVVCAQHADLQRALHDQGEFQLTSQFQSHAVTHPKWSSMSEKRQADVFNAFMKDNSIHSKPNTVQSSNGLLTVQGNSHTARKPGETKRSKACHSQPKMNYWLRIFCSTFYAITFTVLCFKCASLMCYKCLLHLYYFYLQYRSWVIAGCECHR